MLRTFCFLRVWCLNCPLLQPDEAFHGLCLTIIDFGSHSPSCAFSTLDLCSLEESRPASGTPESGFTSRAAAPDPAANSHAPLPGPSLGMKLPPSPQPLAPRLLLGFQHCSPVVQADPALVAVRVAVGAADWLQVPWASYPGCPILADAAGILAAINLRKQHGIRPNTGSRRGRNPHAASRRCGHSACSSCREVNWRYYFESAQAVRRSESSLQKFLVTRFPAGVRGRHGTEEGLPWVRRCLMKAAGNWEPGHTPEPLSSKSDRFKSCCSLW